MTDSTFAAIPDCSDCGPSFEDVFPIASKWRRSIIQGEYLQKRVFDKEGNKVNTTIWKTKQKSLATKTGTNFNWGE
jgi:hypothetical protein